MKKIWFISLLAIVLLVSTQCKKDEEEKDTTPPVITILDSNPLLVDKNSVFVDPGATALDEEDGDISSQIVSTGTVDTSVEDTYYIKYNVKDAAGNAAEEKTREVTVMVF